MSLFALSSGATSPDRVIDALMQYDFESVLANLPKKRTINCVRPLRTSFRSRNRSEADS
jgi:hypothetical protein